MRSCTGSAKIPSADVYLVFSRKASISRLLSSVTPYTFGAYLRLSATMKRIMTNELVEHLNALARDDCYRVDTVLKDGDFETTQRVFFVGVNGAEQGPYVRKYLDKDVGLGEAYERIWSIQREGRRFLHLPLIVDCYNVGDRRAVVMEYVQGETLSDAVRRWGPSTDIACNVFPLLCRAAVELHEGFDPAIIHRDLKPSNIMLTRGGLTVIDFGISRTYDDKADTDTRHFGTRTYAPPEQFGYGQTDVRSDVYALGMLLYFCLTGEAPDAKARNKGFASPLVSDAFRKVIARAAAFDPSNRYESAMALNDAFWAATHENSHANSRFAPSMPSPPRPPFSHTVREAVPKAPMTRIRFSERVKALLSRVPFSVGVTWDVILLLPFILFCIGSVGATFDARYMSAQYAAAPLWLRAVSYGSLSLLIMGPLVFLMLDLRPIDRLISPFSRIPRKHVRIACLVIFAVGVVVFAIASQLLSPINNV